ncbi:hypothetical protein GSY74_03935, partial [Sulfurovum sp. bin170]|uniref:Calx-beta domain-containing protein n=1 Tax=Sulfurovum sp. bin170 TaxID=2695268 RepID=UPI0013DEF065
MNLLLKKLLLLLTLLFSTLLYADGEDISISISDVSANENSGTMTFTITISEAPILPITVDYSTLNGTATAGDDYVVKSDWLLFGAGISERNFEIELLDDTIYEGNENFYIQISTTETGYSTLNNGTGTIVDNELAPLEIRSNNQSITEGDSATNDLRFKFYLNRIAPVGGVTITYNTSDNTATAGEDYNSTSGTVTIPEGESYVYVYVPIIGDLAPELQERFYLNLANTDVGTLKTTQVRGYINDNDAIEVDITSSSVQEGNIGDTNQMQFKIFLADNKAYPLDTPLTISYQTGDGSTPTATANSDYAHKSGTVTFNKGEIEKFVYVDIIGDDDIEENEYIKMSITGEHIINYSSQNRIINDDGSYPSIAFDDNSFSILEGDSEQRSLEFNLTLTQPALAGATFHYETRDGTAETNGSDYSHTYGDKSIAVESTKVTISVPILGDTDIESDESFYLKISNLTNLNLLNSDQTTGTIINDDGSYPNLTFTTNSYSVMEGDSGQVDLNFTMTLDQPALAGSSFDYHTENITADGSSDYDTIDTKTHIFSGGESNITIPIKVNGDTAVESDESFSLIINNEKNLTISEMQNPIGTIINDDGSYPTISFTGSSYLIEEGNLGTKELNITLSLDAPAFAETSIDYYTEDITAQDSSSSSKDGDYDVAVGTLIIPEGNTTASILVTINGDRNIEPDEKFYIYLHNPVNLKTTVKKADATIQNDDEHNDDPFTCDDTMYLSSSIKRGSLETGKMWLHKIDTEKTPFGFEVMDDFGDLKLYNALAYSGKDNYIYGLFKNELVKLTQTGKVVSLGEVTGLPPILTD